MNSTNSANSASANSADSASAASASADSASADSAASASADSASADSAESVGEVSEVGGVAVADVHAGPGAGADVHAGAGAGAGVGVGGRRGRRGGLGVWLGGPWLTLACVVVLVLVVAMVVFGSLIAPHDPDAQNPTAALARPGGAHWLGTDSLGRDVFSRLIAGARTAFVGPLVITAGSTLLGNLLGLWAGYRGGRIDAVVMRWVDLMWSIPGLLVIIVVQGALGGGYWLAVVLLLVLTVPFDTRVVRGATLEQTPRPYVEAARTLGVRDRRIMLSHIWPNVAPVAVANAFLVFATSLSTLAGLSFLGLGVSPGTPDWGLMVAEGIELLFANPVAVLAPAVMIVLTATSMNLIGDWCYERLAGQGATR
jgi:peptide/nickel transport system permease protein